MRLVRRLRERSHPTDDAGMALLTTIMLIMIIGSLSVLMLGVVIAQVEPTLFGAKQSRTIVAAEAGVDAALSQIRSATSTHKTSGETLGDPRKLPCTVQGQIRDDSGEYGYTTTVTYFTDDPRGKDAAWRTANRLPCGALGLSIIPAFAVISAEGTDAQVPGRAADSGDRVLETVYTFQTINQNIQGGPIYSYGNGYCIQADGTTIGSAISYVGGDVCLGNGEKSQWSWRDDYKLHLSSSDLPGKTPLCITGRPTAGTAVPATLEKCDQGSTTSVVHTAQLFSWQAGAQFKVQNASNSGASAYCLGTGSSSLSDPKNKKLMVGECGNNIPWGSFDPSPRVGAAKASYLTKQMVSYAEYGRCADVTDETVGSPFMIIYPCKQDPSTTGGLLPWNHMFNYTEPCVMGADSKCAYVGKSAAQQVYVNDGKNSGTKTCMQTAAAGASPAYVKFSTDCSGTASKWFRTADTGDKQTSWRFEDSYGRCLAVGPKPGAGKWSTMIVAPCSSAPDQKWNAPAIAQDASVDSYRELDH